MKKSNCRWLSRLVDKITKKDQPNNDSFIFYNHRVTLQSGTFDYVCVTVQDMDYRNEIIFNFDFWTKKLVLESYNSECERKAIVTKFKEIYSNVRVQDEVLVPYTLYIDGDCIGEYYNYTDAVEAYEKLAKKHPDSIIDLFDEVDGGRSIMGIN